MKQAALSFFIYAARPCSPDISPNCPSRRNQIKSRSIYTTALLQARVIQMAHCAVRERERTSHMPQSPSRRLLPKPPAPNSFFSVIWAKARKPPPPPSPALSNRPCTHPSHRQFATRVGGVTDRVGLSVMENSVFPQADLVIFSALALHFHATWLANP